MSKSKSSAAAKASPPTEQPQSADVPVDDDFDSEVPRIGPSGPTAEIELVEEELDLEAPPVDAAAADSDAPARPKAPSDKEIEEGGGDSMLAR